MQKRDLNNYFVKFYQILNKISFFISVGLNREKAHTNSLEL